VRVFPRENGVPPQAPGLLWQNTGAMNHAGTKPLGRRRDPFKPGRVLSKASPILEFRVSPLPTPSDAWTSDLLPHTDEPVTRPPGSMARPAAPARPASPVPIVVAAPDGGLRLSSGRSVVPPPLHTRGARRRAWRIAAGLGAVGALAVIALTLLDGASAQRATDVVRAFTAVVATR